MSNQWLLITVPVAVAGLALLLIFVRRLVKAHRAELVLSIPLLAEQEITLETAGDFLLNAEGPRLTRAFAGLDYELHALSSTSAVPLKPLLIPYTSSGFSRARLSLRRFEIATPGRFRLTVSGLSNPAVARGNNLVVTHDRRGGIVGIIVVVVFSAIGFVVGSVLSTLLFLMNR
jgi:hypothetical protein